MQPRVCLGRLWMLLEVEVVGSNTTIHKKELCLAKSHKQIREKIRTVQIQKADASEVSLLSSASRDQSVLIHEDLKYLFKQGRYKFYKQVISLASGIVLLWYMSNLVSKRFFGTLKPEIERRASELNNQVDFLGIVPHHQLPDVLSRYTMFVLPSLYEGMPKTLLEAMSCGLACIGTDVPGTREVIVDGVNGLLTRTTEANKVEQQNLGVEERSDTSTPARRASTELHLGELLLPQTSGKRAGDLRDFDLDYLSLHC